MHCVACNKLLTDFEATRRNAITKDFVDLCKVCFEDVKGLFPVIERKDLLTQSDLDLDGDDDDSVECSPEMNTGDCRDYIDYIVSNDTYGDSDTYK
jgi:hypothetical protein